MSRRRRWLQWYLDLFVMEVRHADGSTFIMSIDTTGFGECWLPLEITDHEGSDVSLVAQIRGGERGVGAAIG